MGAAPAQVAGPAGRGLVRTSRDADDQLAGVTDPRAVPSILKAFPIGGTEADQTRLLGLLGQIDDPRSSRALANLAVSASSTAIRSSAIEVLKRPGRDCGDPGRGDPGQDRDLDRARGRAGLDGGADPRHPAHPDGAVLRHATGLRAGRVVRGYAGFDANGLPVIAQGRELDRMSRDPNPIASPRRSARSRAARPS